MMQHLMRRLAGLGLSTVLACTAGCVTRPVGSYQPSIANQMALNRLSSTVRIRVDATDSVPVDAHAQVRAFRIVAFDNQSWSAYLADALRIELRTSGNYDAASDTVINPVLISFNVGDGRADASARFTVRHGDQVSYDKTLHVHAGWDSHFSGALAAQDGVTQASAIFQSLAGQLFKDPDFVKALQM